jgi:2-C-methyl-D-erythritol 4-phosphate cytidylyltransferase
VLRYLPGVEVHIVQGSERNIKVTYPQDLVVAEALIAGERLPR